MTKNDTEEETLRYSYNKHDDKFCYVVNKADGIVIGELWHPHLRDYWDFRGHAKVFYYNQLKEITEKMAELNNDLNNK